MKPGDNIEYARHGISWQDDGTPLPNQDEDWAPATVLAVFEHPPWPPDAEPDTVARIQPDDQPAFDLNVKLIRPA